MPGNHLSCFPSASLLGWLAAGLSACLPASIQLYVSLHACLSVSLPACLSGPFAQAQFRLLAGTKEASASTGSFWVGAG